MRPRRKGIKPILGCELYVCKAEDHRAETPNDQYNHLLVLAENEEGYRNLIRLTSEASLHGFYRKPRVSKRYLAENCQGADRLFRLPERRAVRGADGGPLREGQGRGASSIRTSSGGAISTWRFRTRGWRRRRRFRRTFSGWRRELEIPMVLTNDSHYLCGEDSPRA